MATPEKGFGDIRLPSVFALRKLYRLGFVGPATTEPGK